MLDAGSRPDSYSGGGTSFGTACGAACLEDVFAAGAAGAGMTGSSLEVLQGESDLRCLKKKFLLKNFYTESFIFLLDRDKRIFESCVVFS